MESQLNVIKSNLNEIHELSKDTFLLDCLEELKDLDLHDDFDTWDLQNYRSGSTTLCDLNFDAPEFQNLLKASEWLEQKNEINDVEDIIYLNSLVLGMNKPAWRKTPLDSHHPFPDPQMITPGLELINEFLQTEAKVPFFQKVAVCQALLFLHPFSEGNYRTVRLLLDYWLMQMKLPTLLLQTHIDFMIVDSKTGVYFSLKHAVTLCLFAMEARYMQRVLQETH